MPKVILIAHNLRSAHNVGSLLRTADGLGINQVLLTGYTPYPTKTGDSRLPHLAKRIHNRIIKTALGAEASVAWEYKANISEVIDNLCSDGFIIAGLEQNQNSAELNHYRAPEKIALIVGREVEGIEAEILLRCDVVLEIPMSGKKESFNVAQAAAIAMYQLKLVVN